MIKPSKVNRSSSRRGHSQAPANVAKFRKTGFEWQFILQVVAIIASALWIFWPTVHGDWIADDSLYITDNKLLDDPQRLWKAWFQIGSFVEYYPIHETVQWLQWQLLGKNPFGYHLTNIVLHIVSAMLIWRLLSKLGCRFAWLGGMIFVVHPMMVESVAWISEFKNTLSLPPFLVALCFWVDYEEHKKNQDYVRAFLWFLVSMLCKITVSPFPVFILLYAWWKRQRIGWGDLKASAPFFLISLVLGATTILAGERFEKPFMAMPLDVPVGGFISRLALAGLTMSFYFSRCFAPVWPSSDYPQWVVNPPEPWQFAPWLVLLGVVFLLWRKRQCWGRHALLGLGFFLLFLAPFLGFNTISYMICCWVYDHFLYIPIIGLIALVVAAIGHMEQLLAKEVRPYGIGIIAMAMTFLAWESHSYAKCWINQETLCVYNLKRNPQSWFEDNNLGYFMGEKGRYQNAIKYFEEALRLNPNYALTHYNLGNILVRTGRKEEGIEHLREAIRIFPNYAKAYNNLGYTQMETGQTEDAIRSFEQALRIDPACIGAHNGLGNAYLHFGKLLEAVEQYKKALEMDPQNEYIHDNLGMILGKMGRISEATEQFKDALQINPKDDTASNYLMLLRQVQDSDSTAR